MNNAHYVKVEDVEEWAALCGKFKQERDDAMEELKEYRSIAENIGAKKAVSEKEKAIRERDEWRECADILYNALGWHDQWPVAAAHYKKLKKKYERLHV